MQLAVPPHGRGAVAAAAAAAIAAAAVAPRAAARRLGERRERRADRVGAGGDAAGGAGRLDDL